jgi:hypothetical protein
MPSGPADAAWLRTEICPTADTAQETDMPTFTWKDSRLVATDVAPWDTTVMLTGPTIGISELVADTKALCQQQSGDCHLMIYCHGAPGYLQLCKEGVRAANLKQLEPLKPYFSDVSIHACSIAKGQIGRAFCTKMALVLEAPIAGAVALQYNTGVQVIAGWLDDKKYDGDYYVHEISGERRGPLRSP